MTRTKLVVSILSSVAVLTAILPACGNKTRIDNKGDPKASAAAPVLGSAESFAILAGTTVTNAGPTVVAGSVGVDPGTAVTGFPPGTVLRGTIHTADAIALQAQNDTTTAYDALAAEPCTTSYDVPTDIGGMTLLPGVYCFASSAELTGTLTLDAGGDAAAVFVFKTVSTLITASNSSVLLTNDAGSCNVFWQVGSSATLGTGTTFVGNILALTSIALQTDASLSGRALARNGAVTLDSNVVSIAACAQLPATPTRPTLLKFFSPDTIDAGGVSTLTITLGNVDATVATLIGPLTDLLPGGVLIAGTATTDCGATVTVDSSSVTLTGGAIPANGSCSIVVEVTAAAAGSYVNTLAAGALQTGNGSNAAAAEATLTVLPPCAGPSVEKVFTPATINAGGISTLLVTLHNSCSSPAGLTAKLTDYFPAGMLTSGGASTTCGGVASTGTDSARLVLLGGSIPAHGSCTLTVDVTAALAGSFCNTIWPGDLQTSNGTNAVKAHATLTVIP